MEDKKTGCQASPEASRLCANNCGFFGTAATMNLCSKCHKDLVSKQIQAKLASSSIIATANVVSSYNNGSSSVTAVAVKTEGGVAETTAMSTPASCTSSNANSEMKVKESPNKCSTCRKRVGLTGFNCRCGDLFCAVHRYSDKHDCCYDYRTAAQDAIAKANPLLKTEKLHKI